MALLSLTEEFSIFILLIIYLQIMTRNIDIFVVIYSLNQTFNAHYMPGTGLKALGNVKYSM